MQGVKEMPFTIIRQDITRMKVDAIVNAANTDLDIGGGVCGAIFKAAGLAQLQAACRKVSPIKTGGAAITPGFHLPAKWIIHAAGPVYSHWSSKQSEKLLCSAYTESLRLAFEHKCRSIAFPLISSGIYGYPKEKALQVAVGAIRDFLAIHDMDVYLVIFDKRSFVISTKLLGTVKSYIDENYVDTHRITRRDLLKETCKGPSDAAALSFRDSGMENVDDWLRRMDKPFNAALLQLVDAKGKTDTQVYKRANIDRKLFSKIRTGKGYIPGKRTILALAIALELSLGETIELLGRAGYTLSHSQTFDLIVEYFIVSGQYDIHKINEVLFKYDQPLLGAG